MRHTGKVNTTKKFLCLSEVENSIKVVEDSEYISK